MKTMLARIGGSFLTTLLLAGLVLLAIVSFAGDAILCFAARFSPKAKEWSDNIDPVLRHMHLD